MLVITLVDVYWSKPGFVEVSGLFLSGGSFDFTWVGNIESAGPVEIYPLVNSEVTRVGNKLGIYDGGFSCITFGVSDRIKLGVEEVADLLY